MADQNPPDEGTLQQMMPPITLGEIRKTLWSVSDNLVRMSGQSKKAERRLALDKLADHLNGTIKLIDSSTRIVRYIPPEEIQAISARHAQIALLGKKKRKRRRK